MNTSSFLVRVCPRSHARYVRLPIFGRGLEDFVRWSLGKGYKHQTVRLYLYALQRLVPGFLRGGIRSSRDFSTDDIQATARRFRVRRSRTSPGRSSGICVWLCLQKILIFLLDMFLNVLRFGCLK